ncbi:MAG: HflC protein [Alphaproteobacteria bacterium]|nr:HflC protein [Alphaproteobacteria bacterium]HCQ70570.1 protease modulator HflC [Rhodospirillaceae bacterium]|tara:strand:- start:57577 stop:58518 length:942 start_codon:yes stop_codon:yes gene_type:complete
MNKFLGTILVIVLVGVFSLNQVFFIVDQRQQAILLQLGQPVGEPRHPGLHMKLPLIQSVRYFDSRILSVDPDPEQVVISSDQSEKGDGSSDGSSSDAALANITGEPIIVDTFARYKIVDSLRFMKTLRTISAANNRIEGILKNATKAALGKTTLKTLLSEERSDVMQEIQARVNEAVHKDELGIEIVDVRIVRADLTPALRTSTVNRMVSELKKRATETRAKGEEDALEIRSTAEKERTVIIAEAERDAQMLRGQGDEQAIKIYADAFNKDREFYGFMRSMEAYKNTLADEETRLILSPNSDFFRYFDRRKGQ